MDAVARCVAALDPAVRVVTPEELIVHLRRNFGTPVPGTAPPTTQPPTAQPPTSQPPSTQPPTTQPPLKGKTWTFEAERELSHLVGRREADGWSAATAKDSRGFLCYGPYTKDLPRGACVARFRLLVDNATADDLPVVTLDVRDATTGRVLVERIVRRREMKAAMTWQDVELAFTAEAGHLIETRTFWHGTLYVREDRVTVAAR